MVATFYQYGVQILLTIIWGGLSINFIAEKGGEAFESEIRDRFDLPKTTVWRLVKRLAREELVEIKKAGGQNLIRIREEFTKTEQNSALD